MLLLKKKKKKDTERKERVVITHVEESYNDMSGRCTEENDIRL